MNISGLNSSSSTIISVVDVNGKIVLQKNIAGENYQLNVSLLLAGNYFVRIESDKNISAIKFEKK